MIRQMILDVLYALIVIFAILSTGLDLQDNFKYGEMYEH